MGSKSGKLRAIGKSVTLYDLPATRHYYPIKIEVSATLT